ncbi:MAG: beta-L-arabinofuranosidase domain-containing protein, partial [bacterium]
MKRIIIVAALLLTPLAALAAAPLIQPFSRHEIRLTPSVWLDAQKRDGDYLLSLEPDRLLYCFRVTAGLPAPGTSYEGWENAKAGLRGHVVGGHYLSALAMMYSSTGDGRFKERGDLMVSELAKCQAANPRGHVGGIPESFFETLEKGERGHIPFYTIHKELAGLRDAWVY